MFWRLQRNGYLNIRYLLFSFFLLWPRKISSLPNSLYRDFVQPMPAGVIVTAIFDCCHSGTVLDLPYAFQPTRGTGMIRMQRNMDALANVGMLYLLMGGMFPSGSSFASLTNHIEGVTGGNIEDYQGLGLDEEATMDDADNPLTTSDVAGEGNVEHDFDSGLDGDEWESDRRYDNIAVPVTDTGECDYGADNPVTAFQSMRDLGVEDDWGQTDGDFDGGDGNDIDCSCIGDVLSNLLSDDS